MAQLNTLPTFAKPEENKVEKLFQSILGGTVAQPQPSFADELKMANEKAKAQRVSSLGKKSVAKQQASKAPLDKKEKSLDEQSNEVATDAVSNLKTPNVNDVYAAQQEKLNSFLDKLKQVDNRSSEASAKYSVYESLLPSLNDFSIAAEQGKVYDVFADSAQNQVNNEKLMDIARSNYEKKADNPYRNVDLESIDRLIASTFGGKVQGMKNVAEPVNEFNQYTGAVNNLQKGKENRAKEILEYMTKIMKPVQTSVLSAGTVKPTAPRQPSMAGNSHLLKLEDNVSKAISKVQVPFVDTSSALGKLEGIVERGNLVEFRAAVPEIAKSVLQLKGVLSDKDMAYADPTNSLATSLDSLNKYLSGDANINADARKNLAKILKTARAQLNESKSRVANQLKVQYSNPKSAYAPIFTPGGVGTSMLNQFEKDLTENSGSKKQQTFEEFMKSRKGK